MKNQDIRNEIKTAGLYLWQIADELGINDAAFSRKLRYELADAEKMKIYGIIEKLSSHKEVV